jgi:putative membrane protein
MMGWGWGWNGSGGYGANWLWMGGMMIFWLAVIGIGIWLVMRLTDRGSNESRSVESPRSALDRRFANGEINVEQYGEARRLLESKSAPHQ